MIEAPATRAVACSKGPARMMRHKNNADIAGKKPKVEVERGGVRGCLILLSWESRLHLSLRLKARHLPM
jgi:hypothetical protein